MQTVSLYDILSKVIPGALCFFLMGLYNWTAHEKISDVLALFFIYLIGYIVDSLSGILEGRLLYKSFRGAPSQMLMEGKSFAKIKINEINALYAYLNSNFNAIYADKQACFRKIYNMVNKTEVPRVKSFLEAYVFSSNILFAYLFSMPVFFYDHFCLPFITVSILIGFLFWYNSKLRAYYFSKEVIECFIRDNDIK